MSPLAEIAAEVGTPVYVYDGDAFRERISRLVAALSGAPHLVCYSLKANDALALVSLAAGAGLGADIVSVGELYKARLCGVPPDRIVFSGVGKRRDEIRTALEAGVRSLNVESSGELDVIVEEARELGVVAPISVRLNPEVESATHAYVATGHRGAKFGLPLAAAREVLRRAAEEPELEAVGVAFHVGSQLLDPAPILEALDLAAGLWRELAADGIALRDLDVGGGLGVPYEGGPVADVDAYADAVVSVATDLGATLVAEPGRWLVAPVGTFLTRVLYVKDVPGARVAVCDGGMNDLIRPSLYGAHHPIEIVGAPSGRGFGAVDVVGPVCESGDFFARGRELPHPEPGDLLAIGYAGAYGRVMGSTYNARPLVRRGARRSRVVARDARGGVSRGSRGARVPVGPDLIAARSGLTVGRALEAGLVDARARSPRSSRSRGVADRAGRRGSPRCAAADGAGDVVDPPVGPVVADELRPEGAGRVHRASAHRAAHEDAHRDRQADGEAGHHLERPARIDGGREHGDHEEERHEDLGGERLPDRRRRARRTARRD